MELHGGQFLRVWRGEHGGSDLRVSALWDLGPVLVPLALLRHQLERERERQTDRQTEREREREREADRETDRERTSALLRWIIAVGG